MSGLTRLIAPGPALLLLGLLLVPAAGAQSLSQELLEQDPRREWLIPPVIRESMSLVGVSPEEFDRKMRDVQSQEGGYSREDLITLAQGQSREVQQLMIKRNVAALEEAAARARRFPTVDFETSLTFIGNPMEPISVKAGEFGSYEVMPGQTVLLPPEDYRIYDGMESTLYDFKLIMDLPLFTWGKITNAIELRKMAVGASDLMIEKKKREMETRVHILVNTLYYMEQIKLILDLEALLGDRLNQLSQEGYDSGMILPVDLMEVKVRVKEIDLARRELEEQQSQLILQLRRTTGLKDLSLKQLDFANLPRAEDLTLPYRSDLLILRAGKENIDLQLLRRQEEIYQKKTEIANGSATFKPDLGLHTELSYSGQRFPLIEADWYGKDRGNLTLTLGIQTPLFDAGKRETDRLLSRQEEQNARYSLQEGEEEIEQFIRQNELKREILMEKIRYQRLKGESETARMEQSRAEWQAGYGEESDFLKAQLDYHNTRIQEYQHTIELCRNYYEVLNVLNVQEPVTAERTEPGTP